MLNWTDWRGGETEWDQFLIRFPDYNIYQSHAWGEHKRKFGWIPHRLTAIEDSQIVAMAQVMVRRFPFGGALAWVNGGPVGRIDSWGEPIREAIRAVIGARHLYCRVNPMRSQFSEDAEWMKSAGWSRVVSPLLSGMSLAYLPSDSETIREAQASRNWRHNLRRSQKYGHVVKVWTVPDAEEMLGVYAAMWGHKKLQQQFSRQTLISMLSSFGERCIVVRCDDSRGRLLAVRGALVLGSKAWDMFAAATPEARKVYASHAAFWELMRQCALRSIRWYDMNGADPVGNKGVYDFKKGSGARDFSYLGEWDWATSSPLRRIANYFIRHRGSGM